MNMVSHRTRAQPARDLGSVDLHGADNMMVNATSFTAQFARRPDDTLIFTRRHTRIGALDRSTLFTTGEVLAHLKQGRSPERAQDRAACLAPRVCRPHRSAERATVATFHGRNRPCLCAGHVRHISGPCHSAPPHHGCPGAARISCAQGSSPMG